MISEKMKGVIFNTQKFSIHDGTGIRTLIFMKGCPLKCKWCSNPESQKQEVELMFVKTKCVKCGKCMTLCEHGAVYSETLDFDRNKCIKCGNCASRCYANAKKMIGRQVTVRELMELIEKDRIFYTNSGGGVTIGGGEPTMQYQFVTELLKACRESHVHTAIETCGYGKWENVKDVFNYTDQVFFDLKAMDSQLHKALTGVDNEIILQNAENVARNGNEIIFRIPLIPGYNDSLTNIEQTGEFVSKLGKFNDQVFVEILPYHDLGKDKYQWLDLEYELSDIKRPVVDSVEECKKLLAQKGCQVI